MEGADGIQSAARVALYLGGGLIVLGGLLIALHYVAAWFGKRPEADSGPNYDLDVPIWVWVAGAVSLAGLAWVAFR